MTEGTQSLRQLNKLRTREAISHVATRLFIERGFDKATIAEVATAAGVAKMTVTNHFPRKEDLVLDIHEDLIAGPGRIVAGRSPGESAFDALRRHLLEALERRDPALGFSGPEFAAMLVGSPALLARLREIHEQREDALADTLAAETHTAGDDLTPRLAAGQLLTVHRTLFNDVLRRTLAGQDNESISRQLAEPARRGFDLLRPSLGDYAIRR
ncbi:TetR/AcrR family transcriptional regulator [Streptosporangium sp. NPDC000396]|uniref:TetR/AcrR family transcriptional regulator n=1 Tax=Streptosporangium sp. NPDC000396 TaxID=3366185 RepID=UPI003679635F